MKQKLFFLLTALMCVFGTSAWALEQDADGIYQIGTAEDLVAFSELVNGGETLANAVLTADIDMTNESANFLPIGNENSMYSGTFDGQGHKISNLNVKYDFARVGLFGVIQPPAFIKNVVVDESCSFESGGNYCGFIGSAWGVPGYVNIESVGMEGTVTLAGGNGAGIVGNTQGNALFHIRNCYVTGNVTSTGGKTSNGAMTGWAGPNAQFENCWAIGEVRGCNEGTYFIRGLGDNSSVINCYCKYGTQVTAITDEQVASGALCYLLNGDQSGITWYQTIGEDPHPVLDATHAKVYITSELRCDGQIVGAGTFSNDANQASVVPDHKYENGVCTVCGQKQEGFLEPDGEGFYNISTGEQLIWFASAVNNGENSLNARLTADIDMMEESANFLPIGNENSKYSGIFDGQGHCISNLNVSLNSGHVGMFGFIQSPATIKNFILDESCSIESTKDHWVGLIGSVYKDTDGNEDVYLENLGMEGSVKLVGGNGGGIIGQNHSAFLHLKNCYMTGNVASTGASVQNGILVGWTGQATVDNCWAIGTVEKNNGGNNYFVNAFSSGSITNCFSKYGSQVPNISDEQLESGELCYLLNGESFYKPAWFQTIGEDLHPVWDSTHGTVYKAGEEFDDVHDEASFVAFKNMFLGAEKDYCETVIAEQALIDVYAECIENMEDYKTIEEFAAAYNEFKSMRTLIESSARVYAALQAKADEVIAYLEENDDFQGEKRDQLEYYLMEYEEPNELYPNGTIPYIMETHTMSEADVLAETAKIGPMLEEAIATGFRLHSDITTLLTNADFSDGYNGWEGKVGTATSSPCAECKNATCDYYQTLTDLRNGVYELQMNGYFRPGNPTSDAGNLTSTNYGAFFYANGIQNYVMAAIEDMVSVEDAVHGENCYIDDPSFPYVDYSIYNDDGELIGYVPGGQRGMRYAAMGGRYVNRVLVNVTDGQLTVGFRMPGTGVANDLMGIANVKLFYHGTLEEASEQIDATLQGMAARAQTLCDYEASYGADYAQYPNYSAALRAALQAAIEAVATTSDVEGKYALVGTFSDLFQQVYDNKKVYVRLMDEAEMLIALSESLASFLSDQDVEEMNNAIAEIYEAYLAGMATDEMIDDITNRITFLPEQVNGVYQIGDAKNLTIFSTMVNGGANKANAVLTADIDMTEYSAMYLPIGNENSKYSGIFDGQGHCISNLNVSLNSGHVGMFGFIQSPATIKNFILDESCSIESTKDHWVGLIGSVYKDTDGNEDVYLENLGMEGSVKLVGGNGGGIIGQNHSAFLHLKNCYMTGNVASTGASVQNGILVGWTGQATVDNCWAIGTVEKNNGGNNYFVNAFSSGSITNCYCKYGTQVNPLTDEQVANGELCYLLNGDQSEISWYQNIGEDPHPVLDATHNMVIKNEDGSYGNITGIETPSDSPRGEIDGSVYDLSGRRVEKMQKGIYIVNGKKIVK